jgi:hypothetical protein
MDRTLERAAIITFVLAAAAGFAWPPAWALAIAAFVLLLVANR